MIIAVVRLILPYPNQLRYAITDHRVLCPIAVYRLWRWKRKEYEKIFSHPKFRTLSRPATPKMTNCWRLAVYTDYTSTSYQLWFLLPNKFRQCCGIRGLRIMYPVAIHFGQFHKIGGEWNWVTRYPINGPSLIVTEENLIAKFWTLNKGKESYQGGGAHQNQHLSLAPKHV